MGFLCEFIYIYFFWYNIDRGGILMTYKIYLVEDDKNLNLILKSYLEKEGFIVQSFLNGQNALQCIESPPDLWILDIMLPDIDGYQLIKEIKAVDPNSPVIFISARDADIDRVLGLELGSEDYLSKPFLPRELVIRTKNLLNRLNPVKENIVNLRPYIINPNSRTVSLSGSIIDLTTKEYDLIMLLSENPNMALSREQILTNIWGDDYFGSDRVVDDLVRRLRKKMPDLNLETIYGYGYRVNLI